jgi:hypothetical protein
MAINAITTPAPESKLVLGPRTRREIELRIRELAARLKPTIYDLAETSRLHELLRLARGGFDA